jgi:hypothetical protein
MDIKRHENTPCEEPVLASVFFLPALEGWGVGGAIFLSLLLSWYSQLLETTLFLTLFYLLAGFFF